MSLPSAKQSSQLPGVLDRVVYTAQHNILERHLPSGLLKEVIRGRQDSVQAGLVVRRNDARAEHIVGGVQRNGQMILFAQVRQPANLYGQADRGDRDVSRADAKSIPGAGKLQCLEQVVELGKRLTHAQ